MVGKVVRVILTFTEDRTVERHWICCDARFANPVLQVFLPLHEKGEDILGQAVFALPQDADGLFPCSTTCGLLVGLFSSLDIAAADLCEITMQEMCIQMCLNGDEDLLVAAPPQVADAKYMAKGDVVQMFPQVLPGTKRCGRKKATSVFADPDDEFDMVLPWKFGQHITTSAH